MLSMPRIVRLYPRRVCRRNLVSPLNRLLARSIKQNKELHQISGWKISESSPPDFTPF